MVEPIVEFRDGVEGGVGGGVGSRDSFELLRGIVFETFVAEVVLCPHCDLGVGHEFVGRFRCSEGGESTFLGRSGVRREFAEDEGGVVVLLAVANRRCRVSRRLVIAVSTFVIESVRVADVTFACEPDRSVEVVVAVLVLFLGDDVPLDAPPAELLLE